MAAILTLQSSGSFQWIQGNAPVDQHSEYALKMDVEFIDVAPGVYELSVQSVFAQIDGITLDNITSLDFIPNVLDLNNFPQDRVLGEEVMVFSFVSPTMIDGFVAEYGVDWYFQTPESVPGPGALPGEIIGGGIHADFEATFRSSGDAFSGNAIGLNAVTIIPEPSSILLAGIAAWTALFLRKR